MQYFVWSWKRDEPNPAYTCTLLDTDGRWRTADCNESHRHACRQTGDNSDLLWQLSAAAVRAMPWSDTAGHGRGILLSAFRWLAIRRSAEHAGRLGRRGVPERHRL